MTAWLSRYGRGAGVEVQLWKYAVLMLCFIELSRHACSWLVDVLQLRNQGSKIMDLEAKEQKMLNDLKNRCQKVGEAFPLVLIGGDRKY